MTDDFAMHTHIQRALPAGFQKRSSLLADLPVLEPRNWGGGGRGRGIKVLFQTILTGVIVQEQSEAFGI